MLDTMKARCDGESRMRPLRLIRGRPQAEEAKDEERTHAGAAIGPSSGVERQNSRETHGARGYLQMRCEGAITERPKETKILMD